MSQPGSDGSNRGRYLEMNWIVVNKGANMAAIGHGGIGSGANIQGGTITNAGGTIETPASNGATLDGASQGALTIVGTYTT